MIMKLIKGITWRIAEFENGAFLGLMALLGVGIAVLKVISTSS